MTVWNQPVLPELPGIHVTFQANGGRICLTTTFTGLYRDNQRPAEPILLCPPLGITHHRWYWNFNQLSIVYSFRPRLRTDLPWADYPSPGNLRFTASLFFTDFYATYADIISSILSTTAHAIASTINGMLPYHFSDESEKYVASV